MIKMICVVCGKEYEPDFERGEKFARMYCSGSCAWSTENRTQESYRRELEALNRLLEEKPE